MRTAREARHALEVRGPRARLRVEARGLEGRVDGRAVRVADDGRGLGGRRLARERRGARVAELEGLLERERAGEDERRALAGDAEARDAHDLARQQRRVRPRGHLAL